MPGFVFEFSCCVCFQGTSAASILWLRTAKESPSELALPRYARLDTSSQQYLKRRSCGKATLQVRMYAIIQLKHMPTGRMGDREVAVTSTPEILND
jgi:hypothetical protein